MASASERVAFKDLVDLNELQLLFEKFSTATGLATGLVDQSTHELLFGATNLRDICVKFHRACPASHEHCKASNKELTSGLNSLGEVRIHHCENGLVDGCTPIIIQGKHFATLFSGQVLFAPPDKERFRRQAQKYGYDEQAYLESLATVPVVSEEKFIAMMDYLSHTASMIAQSGLDRLEARKDSTEREALLQSVFTSVPVGIGLVVDRVFQWTNKKFSEMTGYSSVELKGKKARMLYPSQEEFERVGREKYLKIKESGSGSVDTHFKRKDGSIVDIHLSSSPIDQHDLTAGVTFSALDITEFNKALDIVNRSTSIAFVWRNEEGWPVDFVSENVLELTGYTSKEFTTDKISYGYQVVHPDDLEKVGLEVEVASKDINIENFTHEPYRIITKNKEIKWVLDRSRVKRNIEGRIIHYQGIIEDITEQKRLEEELFQAHKMEAIGLMAAGVAHDLNNILSGIVSYPELLLLDLPEDSELRAPLVAIQESGLRAAMVVADLLTVARGATSAREVHNLNSLIQEYLDSPECNKLKSLHPKITFQHQVEAAQSNILCSSVHVKKSLMNLVINAAEAIVDDGTVVVSTRNQYIDNGAVGKHKIKVGEYVIISVRDTGSGISSADLEHIFEPFYTKKTMGRSGTGLGLAVVWNTMEDHAGRILVESSDKGTCFQLYFPISEEKRATEQAENDTTAKLTGNNEYILVVDDEPQLRDIGCQMLESLGYRADSVSSGELAIEFLKENTVDLILIDMLMEPGMNGRQTYAEILKLYPGQKAVIATGFSGSDDVKATLQLGAGGFIKKPYSRDQLRRAVKEALHS